MKIPAPVLYWKEHFKGLTTDPQESERKYQIGVTYPHVRLPGRQEEFVRFNIAGNSLNAFCPSPPCLHRNDLGILAAMFWFRTKILITIKPLSWQTLPVIFIKISAVTGTRFLTILTESLYVFSGQPLSFWNVHLDQLEIQCGALGSRCQWLYSSVGWSNQYYCRTFFLLLLTAAQRIEGNLPTLLSRFESEDGKFTSFPNWSTPH